MADKGYGMVAGNTNANIFVNKRLEAYSNRKYELDFEITLSNLIQTVNKRTDKVYKKYQIYIDKVIDESYTSLRVFVHSNTILRNANNKEFVSAFDLKKSISDLSEISDRLWFSLTNLENVGTFYRKEESVNMNGETRNRYIPDPTYPREILSYLDRVEKLIAGRIKKLNNIYNELYVPKTDKKEEFVEEYSV